MYANIFVLSALFGRVLGGWVDNRWKPEFPDWDCVHTIYNSYRQSIENIENIEKVEDLIEDINASICPVGRLYQKVVREEFDDEMNSIVPSLTVLIGTRWPVLGLLAGYAHDNTHESRWDTISNCYHLTSPINFTQFQMDSWKSDWTTQLQKYVYNDYFAPEAYHRRFEECPMGMTIIMMWKLMVTLQAKPKAVENGVTHFDFAVKHIGLKELTFGHNWPVMPMLRVLQKTTPRHKFEMDFLPRELLRQNHYGFYGLVGDASPNPQTESPAYKMALRIVATGRPFKYLLDGKIRSLLYVTMVFGYYKKYLPQFMYRMMALGIDYLVIYCMDIEALMICMHLQHKNGKENLCALGTPSYLNKFALPLVFLQMGVDVFYIDFDTYAIQSPTSYLIERLIETKADMLLSASFGDSCICAGIWYYRATDVVREWLHIMISWMYEYTHIDDQQAVSAFLAHGDVDNVTTAEIIADSPQYKNNFWPLLPKPRWAILDPVVQFAHARVLHTTGWMGNVKDMVMFHFLHGDSEFNEYHNLQNWNTESGGYVSDWETPLGDIFYGEPVEYYKKMNPLTDRMIAALHRSRLSERPKELVRCGPLGPKEAVK